MWQELIHALPTFDIAMLEKMPADISGVPNPFVEFPGVRPFLPSAHFTEISSTSEGSPPKQLPHRRKLRQQRRRLAKLGQVVFKVAETSADRDRILKAMMRQKSRRYIDNNGIDGLDRPGYRQYYSAMTERFTWPGPLLVTALEVDGEIISTIWGLMLNGRFLGLVMTFDSDWKQFSPTRLLLEDLFAWSSLHGITIFDFTIGDESYKIEYADRTLSLYQTNMHVSIIGKLYQAVKATKSIPSILFMSAARRTIWKFRKDTGKDD